MYGLSDGDITVIEAAHDRWTGGAPPADVADADEDDDDAQAQD
jgi:hypothetical protein